VIGPILVCTALAIQGNILAETSLDRRVGAEMYLQSVRDHLITPAPWGDSLVPMVECVGGVHEAAMRSALIGGVDQAVSPRTGQGKVQRGDSGSS
jgi:hypothetical protein